MNGLVREAIDKALADSGLDVRRHRRRRRRQGARPLRGRHDAGAVHGRRHGRHRQAADPGAHRGIGRRLDRDRGRQPGAVRQIPRVLAVAWEKQSESNAMWALSISVPFTKPVGAGAGGYFAPHVRAYINRSGAPSNIGAIVAVKDRRNGAKNPLAHLHQPDITVEKVMESTDAVGPDPLRRDLPVLGRRLRDRDRQRRDRRQARRRGQSGGLGARHRAAHRAAGLQRARPGQPAGRPRRRGRAVEGAGHHRARSTRSTSPRSMCRSPGSSRCGWRISALPPRARAGS